MPKTARCPTTQWSLVLAAASAKEHASELGQLCAAYWPPVYAFIRSEIGDGEQAKDLTQDFFARLLARNGLPHARLERARFRSFLFSAVKHFLSNQWDRARAQKRGGGQVPFPLDLDEHRLSWEPADNLTPDKIFEKRWADVTLRRAIRALRREYEVSGHREQFDALKGCLTGDRAAESYREIGSQLGMSEGAVKVAVHRMRLRFGDLLRGEIAHTVADLSEVDDELRYLISIMSF